MNTIKLLPVIFRVSAGEVTAIFPTEPCNYRGDVTCYAHLGQHGGAPFEIWQDEADGSISVANVPFTIRGERWRLSRPLNCRSPWPLWCSSPDEETCERVFTEEGRFSPEFVQLIMGIAP